MAADSVLVNAAFELGKSKIPGDYSDIFNKQYEGLIEFNNQRAKSMVDITEAAGGLVVQGVKTGQELVKRKEEAEALAAAKNKEFSDGWKGMSNDISAAMNKETADIFKGGSSQNISVVKHAEEIIGGYKDQIKKLGFGENPSIANKKQIKDVYKNLMDFRNKLNEERADVMIANELYGTEAVDLHNSYVVRTETGERDEIASANLQAVAALQRNPKVDQEALGITYFRNKDNDLFMRHPTNIMRGIFTQNKYKKDDEAYLAYKNSNIQSPNSPEYSGPVMSKEEWYNSAEYKKVTGTKGGFGMLEHQKYLKEAEYETISVKKLNSMIEKKDVTSNTAANGIINEMSAASTAVKKNSKKLMHADFSRLKLQTYDKYYDLFKAPKANIQYLATNPLTIGYGSSKRTWKDDLATNQEINVAAIETLGIGSDIITVKQLRKLDINGDGTLNPASPGKDGKFGTKDDVAGELDKHQEAKAAIIEKLTNPQTEGERLTAASEMAKYWTQHAEAEFNYHREPADPVVKNERSNIDYKSLVDFPFDREVNTETTPINTDGFAQGSDLDE